MAVNFTNNWKNILDKLESVLETEFKGALPVYKGKDIPKGANQALQLIPTGSVLTEYNATSETREFSVTVRYVFADANVNENFPTTSSDKLGTMAITFTGRKTRSLESICLLYTSAAADE